ncbi:MAG: hypothetical protein HY865_19165 [Chloroflexi bacterium]|nr:hypothetical protein [Chloroflexota bacterium]
MDKNIATKILLVAVILVLAVQTCRLDFSETGDPAWFLLMTVLLSVNFIKQAKKAWKGETIAWNYFTLLDKVTFAVCMAALLIFMLYPIKEEMGMGTILFSSMVGISLSVFVANKFGSEALQWFMWHD